MGEPYLAQGIALIGIMSLAAVTSGYPLAVLCRRTGKPPVIGWLAGTIGVFVFGPNLCLWWLAFSAWKAPPAEA